MSMTREEAIKYFGSLLDRFEAMLKTETSHWGKTHVQTSIEAVQIALTALRPVSREKIEKVWRGEWVGSADGYADGELVYDTWTCSECGYVIDEEDDPDMLPQFCPKCYAAMTDKAEDIVMERLEALKDAD